MSREDRIKAHQAKIDKIIQENRRKQEEELKKAQDAQKAQQGTPAPGSPGGAPAPMPGQALPPGPIQQATPAAAVVPGAQPAPAAPPKAARSEARSILYFKPFDSVVNLGDTFATEVVAETKSGTADEISLLIKYPVGIVNLLSIDHSEIDPLLKDDIEYAYDKGSGELYVHLHLAEAQKLVSRTIMTIYWEALAPTPGADISFEFSDELNTGLFLQGSDILGTAPGAKDGVINTTVMIRAPRAKDVAQKVGERGILMTQQLAKLPKHSMKLELQKPSEPIHAGETFDVTVSLENPKRDEFDRVKLLISFDPSVLEVVDYDRGNWIREGVNIQDGFAHEAFPFDFHHFNTADNKSGLIKYDVATELKTLRATGPVAQIRFLAKRPVLDTPVALVTSDDGNDATGVFLKGTDVLRSKPRGAENLDQIVLSVGNRRPGRVATPTPKGHELLVGRNSLRRTVEMP